MLLIAWRLALRIDPLVGLPRRELIAKIGTHFRAFFVG